MSNSQGIYSPPFHNTILSNCGPSQTPAASLKAHHHICKLMGCQFVLTAVHSSPQLAWDAIRAGVAEIERIENLISSWKDNSQTSRINQMAGIAAVQVDEELYLLIERSLKISQLTAGAFDISGTLSRYYWNFDCSDQAILAPAKVEELRSLVDYHLIELDANNRAVFLQKKGMKIGFGGIGKGYAALRAQQVMQSLGIANGMINASGDLMCWGRPPGEPHWKVKIPDPENASQALFEIAIPFGALVTSGDYENYVLVDGKRYSHIIDPRTGMPVQSLKSVSVVCPNPELGDALATGISVLGPEAGIKLVNQLAGVECVVVDQAGQQFRSNGF